MPRFFFHITNGQKTYPDSTGADLEDAWSARAFARIIVNDLASKAQFENYFVDVRDENDIVVFKVSFDA
jgi:hypothetical protein